MTAFPPHPSVEHLVTVFRRIDAGNILVPAFQRTFVWQEAQIIALLESVYSGYPIGSILMWRVDVPILKVSDSEDIPFPRTELRFPADFVLDGLQRLSTLYGVFHYGTRTNNSRFDVVFLLHSKRFAHREETDERSIALSALFNPRALLDVQQSLLRQPDGDNLVEAVLTLQSRFQEYMIPIVTLTKRQPAEVVSIFERVNSTGTRLSRVDFMRAITWSDRFDLGQALDLLRANLAEQNFDFSDDTLVKAIGLSFGLAPLADVMLALRERRADELSHSVEVVQRTFHLVIRFLNTKLGIYSSDFVPYEGQVLTLFNVFHSLTRLTPIQAAQLRRWFRWVSVNEALQGRPDHYVARMIEEVTSYLSMHVLNVGTEVDASKFLRRRLNKRGALSTAFANLMAVGGMKSLADGRLLEAREFMQTFDTSDFVPIFQREEIETDILNDSNPSAKIIANVVFIPPGDKQLLKRESAVDLVMRLYEKDDPTSAETLESQLLPPRPSRLDRSKVSEFLVDRADYIEHRVRQELGENDPP